jgi:hypothetical protein
LSTLGQAEESLQWVVTGQLHLGAAVLAGRAHDEGHALPHLQEAEPRCPSLPNLVGEVIAVDPEPGMLAEGRKLADEAGSTNITWVQGDSTTPHTLDLAQVRLAVTGAAFHWTDRDQLLKGLD